VNVTGHTRVFGLIGQPVAHSLSPRLMNAALRRLGLDAVYVAWEVAPEQAADAVAGLAALGVAGVNVTYPLKTAVIPELVGLSAAARAAGAVNVLRRDPDGLFVGENTDAGGLVLALGEQLDWEAAGRDAVILGAGGAARAAVHGLLAAGATRATFLVRAPERAIGGLDGLRTAHPDADLAVSQLGNDAAREALAAADLVVQATPVGLGDGAAAALVDPDHVSADTVGFELNYGARPTDFLQTWRRSGRACLEGRDLLAAQGHLALRLWLDTAPGFSTLREAITDTEAAA
jgi:shikimate dehydrogenase